ncbi:M3 family oligoendopeptidase [Paenibacillus agri]|uniref:M3 family oligoendopeptidase n=1 Tax=Paenibacillus agri TaxID=2744309 RepID=A0A850EUL8_9BACL|nr:M3 family oligoendopeptidase [Paenibacillus agri]NUU63560.1 M3 family oligoendopeptidase [Paenibacillus agri]
MNMTWDLDSLYPSFESEKLKEDRNRLDQYIEGLKEWAAANLHIEGPTPTATEAFLRIYNQYKGVYVCLMAYAELVLSADGSSQEAINLLDDIEKVNAEIASVIAGFKRWLAAEPNMDELIESSAYLQEHAFYLKELIAQSSYALSEEVEATITKMQSTGSKAWERLYMETASSALAELEVAGKLRKVTLAELRSMAYDHNPMLRKAAYEAETGTCKSIAQVCAACINGISGEALTVYGMRGYASPLDKVLTASRMDRETLNVMLSALQESLPSFHKFYEKKAVLLGHSGKLPFYDLFAPINEEKSGIAYEDAQNTIISSFGAFSGELADFARKVFEQHWIDAEPRAGKGGYGMCIDIFPIQESRIMTQFTGNSMDIAVLAHEIGHAYHSSCLAGQTMLNTDYPIPIAETASIFCETLVNQTLIAGAAEKDIAPILERSISDAGYYLVDFYARYLFEVRMYERRASGTLSVQEFNELMLACMSEAYGESIDPDTLHSYMWLGKAGYFMAGNEFLNFPYSFGLLFSKGLYAEYLKRGEDFVDQYRLFLSATSKHNIVDVAAKMSIDVHSVDFWRGALSLIEEDIAEFIRRT